jgi:hypothetical protein
LVPNGWHNASNDEEIIRHWWNAKPDANPAIACKQSGKAVLDIDTGLTSYEDFVAWRDRNNFPVTYAVRTGRRFNKETGTPQYGVQCYYDGALSDCDWALDGCAGQIKSAKGYVMAAGCIHPDSGERYEVIVDAPIVPVPNAMLALKKAATAPREPGKKIGVGEGRHGSLMSVAGTLRNKGLEWPGILATLTPLNVEMCEEPISDDDLEHIAKSAGGYPLPEPEVEITLGRGNKPETPVDWRTHYHTKEEMENAPPLTFLIHGFLPEESIVAIAAPVGQRKSLIALNVAHALVTKEKLFGYFEVSKQPVRVLYLCPEMGIRSFTDRCRNMGLMPYVGDTLFVHTMSSETPLTLPDLQTEELKGAVAILDTAIRFLEGDENSSQDMKRFAKQIFRLLKDGAAAVVMLHHSQKGTKDSSELTLENVMRGSGELGAFLMTCWGTRLQDPENEYESASYIRNCKPRDFKYRKPFEVIGADRAPGATGYDPDNPSCRLVVVDPDGEVQLKAREFKGNKDGKDEAATIYVKAHMKESLREIVAGLKAMGIKRGKDWVSERRNDLVQAVGGEMP